MKVNAFFEGLEFGRKVPERVSGLKKRLVMQDVKEALGFWFFSPGPCIKAGCFGFYVRAKRG